MKIKKSKKTKIVPAKSKLDSPKFDPRDAKDGSGQTFLQQLLTKFRDQNIPHGPDDNISQALETTGMPVGAVQAMMVAQIVPHFTAIIEALLIDLADPNVVDTPQRLAKMYVNELFAGRYEPRPKVTDFPKMATGATDNMLCVGPIEVKSVCSHHWAPIIGHCWIAVLPEDKLLGLSKYARLVHWVTARPSLQENMAEFIANEIGQALNTPNVAVIIDATHQCMSLRGAEEPHAITATHVMRGGFRDNAELRQEFLMYVSRCPAP